MLTTPHALRSKMGVPLRPDPSGEDRASSWSRWTEGDLAGQQYDGASHIYEKQLAQLPRYMEYLNKPSPITLVEDNAFHIGRAALPAGLTRPKFLYITLENMKRCLTRSSGYTRGRDQGNCNIPSLCEYDSCYMRRTRVVVDAQIPLRWWAL